LSHENNSNNIIKYKCKVKFSEKFSLYDETNFSLVDDKKWKKNLKFPNHKPMFMQFKNDETNELFHPLLFLGTSFACLSTLTQHLIVLRWKTADFWSKKKKGHFTVKIQTKAKVIWENARGRRMKIHAQHSTFCCCWNFVCWCCFSCVI
jgi:hypothetical protein